MRNRGRGRDEASGAVKPAAFEYHRPSRIDDVVALLAEHGDEAKVLAGGQSLVPMLALRLARFEHLVDINRVAELAGHRARRRHGRGRRGDPRRPTVERDAEVAAAVPLLGQAVPLIGHFQIRNRGTVGGSIAHADPAAELPGGRARARCRARGRVGTGGTRTVAGGRVLRRHVDHDAGDRRAAVRRVDSRSGRAAPASRSTRSPGATATSRSRAPPSAVELDDDDAVARVRHRAARPRLDAAARDGGRGRARRRARSTRADARARSAGSR